MHQIFALWLQLHILGKRPVPEFGRGPSLALPRRDLTREGAEICSDRSEWERERQRLLQFACFGICFSLVLFPLPIEETRCALSSVPSKPLRVGSVCPALVEPVLQGSWSRGHSRAALPGARPDSPV